jgi:fatty acid desaturase
LFTSSGLGMFQVVIFHHCSHGTVFRSRDLNILVGRLISTILLFKHFDAYKDGHMLHHSNSKLLTEEDEFADFVFGMCGLEAASPKHVLWRRIALSLVSPMFHARFLLRRIRGAWCSPDWAHNGLGIAVWAIAAIIAAAAGKLVWFLAAWVLPVTVLLQIATVFRIICEHRFPSPEVMANRNRDFACHATAGVFAGVAPPSPVASRLGATLRWAGWWAEMLTLHLFVRLFVLVGDAPCHDYHHRRPASRKWTSYIQARQLDVDSGSPGFGADYSEVWGLFAAVDANLATLARTPREALGITP